MNLFYCVVIFILFNLTDINKANNVPNRKELNKMYQEIDNLMNSWNKVGKKICKEEKMSEIKNDQIYQCLRNTKDPESRNENLFLKRCELKVFRSKKFTKNQVRLAICTNNQQIIENFSGCHLKVKSIKPASKSSRNQLNEIVKKETKKIKKILNCIKKVIKA